MKKIAVLGCTGSIGRQTLEVIREYPEKFQVCALAAAHSVDTLVALATEFRPKIVAVADENAAKNISERLPEGVKLICGEDAACRAASMDDADVTVNGISGFSGTKPLLAALAAGKTVALANKESIVCAHKLVKKMLGYGGRIIPVDSEQSAIFQCLSAGMHGEMRRLILTASGGPFRNYTKEMLNDVTVEQAKKHPTWSMGEKITIDSASLFNKGLEIMEASYLFDISGKNISVAIHPQSVVHSMVEFCDSAIIAQMSLPDMRLAIYHALTYPERCEGNYGKMNICDVGKLEFFEPQNDVFPALKLAYAALDEGEILPIVYNGANETAVHQFVQGKIRFVDIANCVEYAMTHVADVPQSVETFEDILVIDREARRLAADA